MLNFQAILLSILAALVPIGVVQGNSSSNAGGGVTLSPILISEFIQYHGMHIIMNHLCSVSLYVVLGSAGFSVAITIKLISVNKVILSSAYTVIVESCMVIL